MIAPLLALALAAPAQAEAVTLVFAGETLEAVAERVGLAGQADALRAANDLPPGAQPTTGDVLRLPGAGDHHQHDAAVLSLRGAGTRAAPGGAPEPLAIQDPLPLGTTVCTGADSFATLRLAVSQRSRAHDDISLLPETCITIEGAASDPRGRSSLVRLAQGSVTVQPGDPDAEGGLVAVQTDDGVTAGQRGGFRVHKEAEASRTEAITSPLSVFGAGVEQPLEAGQGSRVRAGEAPGAPVQLALPGLSIRPLDGAPLRRPDFSWEPVERARAYQLEVAVSPDFHEIVYLTRTQAPAWEPQTLLLPARVPGHWWRVTPVDALGFLGMPGEGRALGLPTGARP